MAPLPDWLQYLTAYAAIFSSVFVGIAGLVFTYLQWRFAKGQPKRDLEAHRRSIRIAKRERLINDFAVMLRHSVAIKRYIYLQSVSTIGLDEDDNEEQRLEFLRKESEGLTLAIARAQLEGVDQQIIRTGEEQYGAARRYSKLNQLLSERIDKKDGGDLTFLTNSVKKAHDLATQKGDELAKLLKMRLDELENPETI